MDLPERISQLPEYPFPRLRRLLDGESAGNRIIDLSVGEPRFPLPDWVCAEVAASAQGFGRYPPNCGTPGLLAAVSAWLGRRYGVEIDPDTRIMTLNGTREGLFNASLALCPERKRGGRPYVLIPNPFYPAYAAGAAAAGGVPYFVPAGKESDFLPDFPALPDDVLNRASLLFLCSPSNPQGAVASMDYLKELLALAERYGFRILADECYSEIYRIKPPPGILQAAAAANADPEQAAVFHSLSKRSGLPGLRSGFFAGGAAAVAAMKQLRTYGGAPVSTPLLAASERAWNDEDHVERNRTLIRARYRLADEILGGFNGYSSPEAGLFLWLDVGDGKNAALRLWRQTGLRVVPGEFLSRTVNGKNPGSKYIRAALTAGEDRLRAGLERLRAGI